VIAKLGAEGLLTLAVPDRRLGVAISDAGGSQRGLGPAAVAVLSSSGSPTPMRSRPIREKHSGAVTNFAGQAGRRDPARYDPRAGQIGIDLVRILSRPKVLIRTAEGHGLASRVQ
jgi:hypothetical protein